MIQAGNWCMGRGCAEKTPEVSKQHETAALWQQRGQEISWAVVTGAGHKGLSLSIHHGGWRRTLQYCAKCWVPRYKTEIVKPTKFSKRLPKCLGPEVLVLWGEVEGAGTIHLEAKLAQEEVNTSPSALEALDDTARLPSYKVAAWKTSDKKLKQ